MGSKGESEPTAGGATTLEVAFETELEPIVEFEDVDSTGGIRLGVWPRYSVSHSSRSSRLEKNALKRPDEARRVSCEKSSGES